MVRLKETGWSVAAVAYDDEAATGIAVASVPVTTVVRASAVAARVANRQRLPPMASIIPNPTPPATPTRQPRASLTCASATSVRLPSCSAAWVARINQRARAALSKTPTPPAPWRFGGVSATRFKR